MTEEKKKVLNRLRRTEGQIRGIQKMIDEEKVRREIDREKKRIDNDERQFNSEITKLLGYIQKVTSEVEKQL